MATDAEEIQLIEDAIDTIAVGPASATINGNQVVTQSLLNLIAAAKYRRSTAVLDGVNSRGGPVSGWGGALRMGRVVLPGSTGPSVEVT